MTDFLEPRVYTDDPARAFAAGLDVVARTRMKDLPILHPGISVRAHDFRRWHNDWIGVVTTPWAIFAVYLCGNRGAWVPVRAGATRTIELPAGDFPFLAVDDPVLGGYLMMSLKSPLLDVGDQQTADLIAKISLETMLRADRLPKDDEDAEPLVAPNADGKLHRVIPIRIAPPKNIEETPVLTPPPPEPKMPERPSFFKEAREKPLSRRDLFRGGRSKANPEETSAEQTDEPPKGIKRLKEV